MEESGEGDRRRASHVGGYFEYVISYIFSLICKFYRPGKLLSFGPDSCPGEKESFSRSVINSFRQSAFAEGTDYAILEDARNLCDVFPEIAYNPSYVGSVDNNAGFLKADKALQGTLVNSFFLEIFRTHM